MAATSEIGIITYRNEQGCDWIVNDGPFELSPAELMLRSPLFDLPNHGGRWRMTIHQSPDQRASLLMVTVMNEVWSGKSGFGFEVGLVDKDGHEVSLGKAATEKNGACAILCNKSVAEFRYFLTRCCEGRLIVFCKASTSSK